MKASIDTSALKLPNKSPKHPMSEYVTLAVSSLLGVDHHETIFGQHSQRQSRKSTIQNRQPVKFVFSASALCASAVDGDFSLSAIT